MSKARVFKVDLSQPSGTTTAPTPIELTSGSEYDAVKHETAAYSITPRTFVERTLLQDSATCSRFVDKYYNDRTIVSRFGIDPNAPDVQIEIARINAAPRKLTEVKSSVASISKPTAGGVDPRMAEIQAQRLDAKTQITKQEKDCIDEAIKHLTPGFSSHISQTALVDILERDVNGIIASNIHIVVLFAQNGKYLVIDPSNASFSHILAGASDDIRLCFNKKFQVYSKPQGAVTGPNTNEWRDCIDVAVKLAFNIEMNTKLRMYQIAVKEDTTTNNGEIDFVSLRDSVPVREVTNQQDMYAKLPGELSRYPTRLKQSSDVKIEKSVTACLTASSQVFKASTEKLSVLGLYHLQSALGPMVKGFYDAASVATDHAAFCTQVLDFLSDRQGIAHDAEAVRLLALELGYIDQLQ